MNMKNSHGLSSSFRSAPLWLSILLIPSLAQAHPGMPGHTHGLENGVLHPLSGLDHICAMIAVGIWAVQRGGRALWLMPTTFVSIMILGGALGMGGMGIPCVEQGIAASVLVLGIFIAAAVRLPLPASLAIVGLFAVFHGYAHGVEMPGDASGFTYATGFVLATISLHLCGISLGMAAKTSAAMPWLRFAGGAIAMCGGYFCFAP
jgi:urease accessory protein